MLIFEEDDVNLFIVFRWLLSEGFPLPLRVEKHKQNPKNMFLKLDNPSVIPGY